MLLSATLRIAFVGFWPGFDPSENFIVKALDRQWELSEDPQVLFFSCFSGDQRKFPQSLKIFFTGENVRPNRAECDHSISFDLSEHGGRDIRWPLYNLYYDPRFDPIVSRREKFCGMVVSNLKSKMCLDFFAALGSYKKVDSGGKALNNVGGPVKDKIEFLKGYKFGIAFENSHYPGYTTEKILQAKKIGCVPIYWGNPEVAADFNTDSFVNAHAFPSFSRCIEFIEHLDNDDRAFSSMQRQPLLMNNEYTKYSDPKRFKDWLNYTVSQKPKKKIYALTRPTTIRNKIWTIYVDFIGRSRFANDLSRERV